MGAHRYSIGGIKGFAVARHYIGPHFLLTDKALGDEVKISARGRKQVKHTKQGGCGHFGDRKDGDVQWSFYFGHDGNDQLSAFSTLALAGCLT